MDAAEVGAAVRSVPRSVAVPSATDAVFSSGYGADNHNLAGLAGVVGATRADTAGDPSARACDAQTVASVVRDRVGSADEITTAVCSSASDVSV